MRARIVGLLNHLKNSHKVSRKDGFYPPDIKPSINQTDDELYKQLKQFVSYLENPHYSYLTKNSK